MRCVWDSDIEPIFRILLVSFDLPVTDKTRERLMTESLLGPLGITLDWNNSATVNACGNHVRAQFRQLLNGTNNAVFLDSCKHHCGEWNAITIDGLVCSEAVNAWYYGGVKSLPKGDGVMDAGRPYPCPDGTPGCCPAKFP